MSPVLLPESDESRLTAASTIPTAMTTSAAPVPGASCSPAATAMSAAIAPSVETIGATTPTLPTLTPVYTSSSPTQLPTPARRSHRVALPSTSGTPRMSAHGSVRTSPTSMTQASTDVAPISLVARVAQIMVVAQANAAPSPPRTAIMDGQPYVALR